MTASPLAPVLKRLENLITKARVGLVEGPHEAAIVLKLLNEIELLHEELAGQASSLQRELVTKAVRLLEPWKKSNKRSAWKPVVAKIDGPVTATKFSGIPWLASSEPWPRCNRCRTPLQLLLQLNLAELPKEMGSTFGRGLIQCFYYVHGEDEYGDNCAT